MQYYTSPISGRTFSMKSEVLEYLFSQTDEHILEIKESGVESTLQVHKYNLWCFWTFILGMMLYLLCWHLAERKRMASKGMGDGDQSWWREDEQDV